MHQQAGFGEPAQADHNLTGWGYGIVLERLGYDHDLDEPVIRLWSDARHRWRHPPSPTVRRGARQDGATVTGHVPHAGGVPGKTMAALALAVFTVSVAYGIVLPLLPALIERLLGTGSTPGLVSRHTGLLTAVYALALFLTAPTWGRFSDRHGRRSVLLIALLGFSAATLVFSLSETLPAIYVQRFLTGTFAAGVSPIASAAIGDVASAGQRRGRQLAFVSMASIAGFLLGPTLGVFTARIGTALFGVATPLRSLTIPLASTAVLASLASGLVALAVPNGQGPESSGSGNLRPLTLTRMPVTRLLILTFVVSASIGVFEVGLALRGTQELGFTPYEIALMFTECSLVMFVMQAVVFSPLMSAENTRWLIAPALFVLGVGLVLMPWASDFSLIVAVIAGVAGSAGIASPILTYWISTTAGSAQGWELGRQTAAASLGVTAGSVAGGVLFNIGTVRGVSFLLAAGLVAAGVLLSLGLARALVPETEHASRERQGGRAD